MLVQQPMIQDDSSLLWRITPWLRSSREANETGKVFEATEASILFTEDITAGSHDHCFGNCIINSV